MTEILIIIVAMLFAGSIAYFILALLMGKASALNRHKASFSDYSNEPIYIFEHRRFGLSDIFQTIGKK